MVLVLIELYPVIPLLVTLVFTLQLKVCAILALCMANIKALKL